METKTNKTQKKDTIMAKTTKTTEQRIEAEAAFLISAGLDEATAKLVATNKIGMQDKETERKAEEKKQAEEDAKNQAILDKAELERVAGLLGITVPENASRFVVSTIAVKEEQEIDGKKQMVEVGRKVSKVRLYITLGASKRASEINSLIKNFETEEEVLAEVEAAKLDLLSEIA